MNYTDTDLFYLAFCTIEGFTITLVGLSLFIWMCIIFKQIAKIKVEDED